MRNEKEPARAREEKLKSKRERVNAKAAEEARIRDVVLKRKYSELKALGGPPR